MALFENFTPEARLAMAAGVLGGSNVATGLSMGMQNALPLVAQAKEQKQADQVKNLTAERLKTLDPELSQAVTDGVMAPNDAYVMYLKKRAMAREAAKPDLQFIQAGDRVLLGDKNNGTIKELGNYQKPANLPAIAEEYNFAKTQGFSGTFEDYQNHKANIDDGKTSDRFKTELDTMKAYRGEDPVKTFQTTRDAYEKVRTSSQLGSAQGDIGLIFGFMKMLDPTSVVREGEFATAQNSGGIDETVYNIYNKALNGERLTPEQRRKFVEAAQAQYENAAKNLEGVNTRYKGLADAYQVPSERFLEIPKEYPPLTLNADPVGVTLPDGTQGTIRRTK